MNHDIGLYSFLGSKILEGQIIYLDVIGVHTFATPYIYALSFLIFGKTVKAIYFLAIIIKFLIVLLVYQLSNRFFINKRIGELASLLMLVALYLPGIGGYVNGINSDMMMIILISLAILSFLKHIEHRRISNLIFSGCLIGIAILFKYVAILTLGAIWIYYIVRLLNRNNLTKLTFMELVRLKDCLLLSIFALIPLGILILFYLQTGGLKDFIFWSLTMPLKLDVDYELKYFVFVGLRYWVVWIGIFISLIIYLKNFIKTKLVNEKSFLIIWLLCLSLPLIKRHYGQYFLAILVPGSILCSEAFLKIVDESRNLFCEKKDRIFPFFYLFIIIITFTTILASLGWNFLEYRDARTQPGTFISVHRKVAEYIKSRTKKEDHIFVFWHQPQIYFFAERNPPIKSAYIVPVSCKGETVISELRSHTVKYVIIQDASSPIIEKEEFQKIYDFIVRNYKIVKVFHKYQIYYKQHE